MRDLLVMCAGVALVTACVDTSDDALAESAPIDGKDDGGPAVTGLYATTATLLRDGDIPNLELRGDTYVRNRCYHSACSGERAETDRFDTFTSSSGKTYIRFWSFKFVPNPASGDRDEVPVVADTYEITKTSTTIKLRKTYSSRWQTLKKKSPSSVCTASGGSWASSTCTCPGPTSWPGVAFVPGAGGCIQVSGTDESECDGTDGSYTDDDSTLIGSYCRCGVGRYAGDSGCASN
jgi:hypothetical protein